MCYSVLMQKTIKDSPKRYGAIATRNAEDDFARQSASDPKQFLGLSPRIYPGHFGPVFFTEVNQIHVELMRYGTYPPIEEATAKKYTSFNARSDNLRSHFWSNAFMRHHGFVLIKAFFEWVAVRDLIKAGTVSLDEVETSFQRQQVERKAKILATGKTYKPTPTELKKTVDRQTIIQFVPEDGGDLIVPVIFSRDPVRSTAEAFNGGFAIITDTPPLEIQRAGHDRCPVIFDLGTEMEWMNSQNKTAHDLEIILGQRRRTEFKHQLAEVS